MQKPILWMKHVLLSGHVGQEESSSQVLQCSLGFWHCREGQAPPCPAQPTATHALCAWAQATTWGWRHKLSQSLSIFSVLDSQPCPGR